MINGTIHQNEIAFTNMYIYILDNKALKTMKQT